MYLLSKNKIEFYSFSKLYMSLSCLYSSSPLPSRSFKASSSLLTQLAHLNSSDSSLIRPSILPLPSPSILFLLGQSNPSLLSIYNSNIFFNSFSIYSLSLCCFSCLESTPQQHLNHPSNLLEFASSRFISYNNLNVH